MRLKVKQILAGPRGVIQPGTEITVDADEAKQLIDCGACEPAAAKPSRPTASKAPASEETVDDPSAVDSTTGEIAAEPEPKQTARKRSK